MKILRLQGDAENPQGVFYEVDAEAEILGEGGQGVVRQGEMVDTIGNRRPVAIKFLYNDLPKEVIERARLESSVRIKNENLLEMLAFIELTDDMGEKRYHVVSELLEGVMLFDLLKGITTDSKGQTIPYAVELLELKNRDTLQFAKQILKPLLSGIQALHDKGYIHRDIDPSNIMITRDRHIKLIDFGLVKRLSTATTSDDPLLSIAGEFIGKPEYAAPELVLGDRPHQNEATDLYSVGILFYQLLTGNLPFSGTRFDILDAQLKQKPSFDSVSNRRARKVLATAIDKKQELRYPSAAAFRLAIDGILPEDDVKEPQKNWLKIALCMLLLIVSVGGIGYYLIKRSSPLPPPPLPPSDTLCTKYYDTVIVNAKLKYIREINVQSVDSIEISRDTMVIDSIVTKRPIPPKHGTIDLGYGIWEGEILGSKPNGLGKITYRQSHPIGDTGNHTAQPGDAIEGQFENDHWVNVPKWYKNSGDTETIIM